MVASSLRPGKYETDCLSDWTDLPMQPLVLSYPSIIFVVTLTVKLSSAEDEEEKEFHFSFTIQSPTNLQVSCNKNQC